MTFVRQLEFCGIMALSIHWSYCKFIIPTPSGNFGKSYNLEFSESLITLAKQGTLGRFPQFHKLINSSGDRLRSVALASILHLWIDELLISRFFLLYLWEVIGYGQDDNHQSCPDLS